MHESPTFRSPLNSTCDHFIQMYKAAVVLELKLFECIKGHCRVMYEVSDGEKGKGRQLKMLWVADSLLDQ